ncbi:DUF7523 family protein [Halorussus halobius]|uniref:DUF7523 family protein n=1 Tax=Halorussus halobius TaxID=1710537 RepID=UPI00109218CC|nr:hypothetical protein [Halorussus halobius]
MTLAEDAREAARRRPALLGALRDGVVNYTAAARSLADEVDGDAESVATALRRYAESLPDREREPRDVRVSMRSGLGETDGWPNAGGQTGPGDDGGAPLAVGDTGLEPGEGTLTAVVAEGEVDGRGLAHLLDRLDAAGVDVRSAGVAGGRLVVAVDRRDGPNAVRVAEDALATVPAALGSDGSE